ncbi:MAG: hypothetical protein ABI643_01150 [Candidatus Doudnabacteria bacterium]
MGPESTERAVPEGRGLMEDIELKKKRLQSLRSQLQEELDRISPLIQMDEIKNTRARELVNELKQIEVDLKKIEE